MVGVSVTTGAVVASFVDVVGTALGILEGDELGLSLGTKDGVEEGTLEGAILGRRDGAAPTLGCWLGAAEELDG
jgi:hypothetical protein